MKDLAGTPRVEVLDSGLCRNDVGCGGRLRLRRGTCFDRYAAAARSGKAEARFFVEFTLERSERIRMTE